METIANINPTPGMIAVAMLRTATTSDAFAFGGSGQSPFGIFD